MEIFGWFLLFKLGELGAVAALIFMVACLVVGCMKLYEYIEYNNLKLKNILDKMGNILFYFIPS